MTNPTTKSSRARSNAQGRTRAAMLLFKQAADKAARLEAELAEVNASNEAHKQAVERIAQTCRHAIDGWKRETNRSAYWRSVALAAMDKAAEGGAK